MSYVYIKTEPGLWTVGFYRPDEAWEAESDHCSADAAAQRVHFLNGGLPTGFAVVPVEPTEAMKIAGGMIPDAFKGTGAARGNADRVFRAMVEAAPHSDTERK